MPEHEPAEPAVRTPRADDDVAAMRRELEELKQAVRDSIGGKAPPRKKRKPTER